MSGAKLSSGAYNQDMKLLEKAQCIAAMGRSLVSGEITELRYREVVAAMFRDVEMTDFVNRRMHQLIDEVISDWDAHRENSQ